MLHARRAVAGPYDSESGPTESQQELPISERRKALKKTIYWIVCVGLVALIIATFVQAQAPTLTAVPVAAGPTLDGDDSDDAWTMAQAFTVPVSGGKIGSVEATLKAVYTASDIYMLLQWPDATMSIDKNMWAFDGSEWTKTGNEDRFGILWNIDDSIAGFNTGGCAVTCHAGMWTNSDTEFGDMWHWKAARSNPMGYVDDKYLNNTADDEDGGRHGDGGDSTYSDNADEDGDGAPDFVWSSNAPSTPPAVSDALATRFLLRAEEAMYSQTNPLTGVAWESGDTIPGYRLREAGGSRSDVEALGVWADGVWTVEVKRALDTGANALKDGQKVDQVFEAGETYHFALALMDDTGSNHSVSAGTIALVLSSPALPATGGEDAPALSVGAEDAEAAQTASTRELGVVMPAAIATLAVIVLGSGALLWARNRRRSSV